MRLINLRPDRGTRLLLGVLPFAVLAIAYLVGSAVRLAENPSDKLLPSVAALARSIEALAFTPDRRTGEILLWADTLASLERLGWGLGIAAAGALAVGLMIAVLPLARAVLAPLVGRCCRTPA